MRVPLAFLASAVFAAAQSHPSWWTYASPSATALVGVDWQTVRTSPFADAIEAELWSDLGFPDLPALHNTRQFVISSPALLALASGNFSGTALRDQAAKQGFKAMTYRGIDMWFAPEKGAISLARLNDQILLMGESHILQEAVDRSMDDARNYSPLLARAAPFSQKDLWVVASRLPDDLANRFVPLDIEADRFEGSVSLRSGLQLDALLGAGSEKLANESAAKIRQAVPTFPAIARGLQIDVADDSVTLAMTVTREQVISALRGPDPLPPPVETIKVETPSHVEYIAVEKPETPKPEAPKPEPPKPAVVEPPQVIRIIGLDDGPREIVMPPAKPVKKDP